MAPQNDATSNFWNYYDARNFAQSLGLQSRSQWYDFCGRKITGITNPERLPSDPLAAYGDQFILNGGWKSWLSAPKCNYVEAKRFAWSLGLKNSAEWKKWSKALLLVNSAGKKLRPRPAHIPGNPQRTYGLTFEGWSEFLGNTYSDSRFKVMHDASQYRDYDEASKFVHSLGLRTFKEWQRYCSGELAETELPRLPSDIPPKLSLVTSSY